jgi:hypothetical protein
MASARVTGLAGAYVAIAEGTDGDIQTPVAPAMRAAHSVDHFDYELGLGLTLPATLTSTDFFNTGHGRTRLADAEQQGFVFVTPSLNLTWGTFGLGATLELQNYSLRRSSDATTNARQDELAAEFTVGHLQAAELLAKGQLAVGVGVRVLSLAVKNPGAPSGKTHLFATIGAGLEVGALWKPTGERYRLGAALRSAVSTNPDPQSFVAANAAGDRVVGDPADPLNAFWLPDRIDQPWDLNLGVAVQLGPRPFNPPWVDPDQKDDQERLALRTRAAERRRQRDAQIGALRRKGPRDGAAVAALDAELESDEALDEVRLARVRAEAHRELQRRHAQLARPYVRLSLSVVMTGPVAEAVGVESFLQRVTLRSGERTVYSPRLGIETEMVPNWLKLRGGSYAEPSRFATGTTRLHGTFGFDAKVFAWTIFGLFEEGTEWHLSTSVDGAARYLGWGLSAGVWH